MTELDRMAGVLIMLESTELELAAVGISIAAGCVPCTRYHITEAGRSGASSPDILKALRNGVAVASTASSTRQSAAAGSRPSEKKRRMKANAAALEPMAR